MKEYEIVFTYLNGCAGSAYPQTSFEEAELNDPADFVRAKHGKDFPKFVKEMPSPTQTIYKFDSDAVSYHYEFNEL